MIYRPSYGVQTMPRRADGRQLRLGWPPCPLAAPRCRLSRSRSSATASSRTGVLRLFGERRKRQHPLEPPLRREQKTEAARGCVSPDFVNVAAKVLCRRKTVFRDVLHSRDDSRDLLICQLVEEVFHRPSTRNRSVVAPLAAALPLGRFPCSFSHTAAHPNAN